MKQRKALSLLLTLAMCLSMVTSLGGTARADGSVSYLAWNGTAFEEQSTDDYTTVGAGTTTWSNGWYVVSSDVVINNRVNVSGTVNLILCDGATMAAMDSIIVLNGNTLNIYAQSGGTGELIAYASSYNAGIGSLDGKAGGAVTIHGGTVTATGGRYGTGIGGGDSSSSTFGNVTINGGTVTATGGYGAAGIGCKNYAGCIVTINGGTVTATGGMNGAGIGGGVNGVGVAVTINGGTVTATGGSSHAAGIGAGADGGDDGDLSLGAGVECSVSDDDSEWSEYDGSTRERYMKTEKPLPVAYRAYNDGTGVFDDLSCDSYNTVDAGMTAWADGGWYVVSSDVEITSRVEVTGTANLILCDGATLTASAGVNVSSDNTLNIYAQSVGDGALIAGTSAASAAGIGGNEGEGGGTVTIHGGTVTATGGDYAAGIGGGQYSAGGDVTIHGGTVTATGGAKCGAGIGRGYDCHNGGDGDLTLGTGVGMIASADNAVWSEYDGSTRMQYMKTGNVSNAAGASLDLNGKILLNVGVTIPNGANIESYAFTDGTTVAASGEFNAAEWTEKYGEYYLFTCPVSPKDIAKPVYLNLYDSTGEIYIYRSGVMNYINAVNGQDDIELKDMTAALQNYGHYAAENFGITPEADAVGALADDMETVGDLSGYGYSYSGSVAGLTFNGMTLELASETAIYLCFTADNPSAVTANIYRHHNSFDTNEAEVLTGEDIPTQLSAYNCVVKIGDIRARQLDNAHDLTVSYNGSSYTIVNLSALSYANQVLSNAESGDELKNVVAAMRVYNMAAETYFESVDN